MRALMLEQDAATNDATRASATLGGGRTPRRATGRPRKQVDATLVEELAKIMASRAEIAAIARCSVSTLDRHFDAAIKRGNLHAKGSLRRRQFEIAMAGNVTMLIWLGKQYLGQVEKQELTGTDGGPIETVARQVMVIGERRITF